MSQVSGANEVMRGSLHHKRKYLCLISLLSLLAVLLFYVGDVPWLGLGRLQGSFIGGQGYHELCLLLLVGPVVLAAFIFRIKGGVIVSVVESLAVFPHTLYFSPYPDPLFRLGTFTIISLLLSGLIGRGLNSREELRGQQSRLERFLSQTIDVQERERQYLARELHDESAQLLVDLSHDVDELLEDAASTTDAYKEKLRRLRAGIDEVLEGTRRFIRGLRPPLLEEMGLGPALQWLAEELREEEGIEVEVDVQDEGKRLSEVQELTVFRIAQEALNNVRKHSGAHRAALHLEVTGDKARLRIEDSGAGFKVPAQDELINAGKFGLIGIRERARLAGGQAKVESTVGKGTVITVEIPVLGAK